MSEIRDYKITKLPKEYLKGCEMINMGYFEKIWKMLKASKPFSFFCASANIYLTEPVYKLINSRIAKEGEKKKSMVAKGYRGQGIMFLWRNKLT